MSTARRVERLERHGDARPVAPIETIEAYRLPPEEAEARIQAAMERAEAIAGPWRPGDPPRVVVVNCVRREDDREGDA